MSKGCDRNDTRFRQFIPSVLPLKEGFSRNMDGCGGSSEVGGVDGEGMGRQLLMIGRTLILFTVLTLYGEQ